MNSGHRALRRPIGNPSSISNFTMELINGKDWEQKISLFDEKSIIKKNSIISKEFQNVMNSMDQFLQDNQKNMLNLEKKISKSLQNQMKHATTRLILDDKFIKDSAISKLLEDLKDPNDIFNKLSKNLQKLHKGYLELKISRKIFKEMTQTMHSRFNIFTENLSKFIESESTRLFSFMFDTENQSFTEMAKKSS